MTKREYTVRITTLPDKRCRLDYDDPATGKRVRKIVPNKTVALQRQREIEEAMRNDLDPEQTRIRFGDLATLYLASYTGAPAVESRLRLHVIPHWRNAQVRRIDRSDVQNWINAIPVKPTDPHGFSPHTVEGMFAAFSNVLRFGRGKHYLAHNPCEDVKRPHRTERTVPPEAVEDFAALARSMPRRYRLATVLAVALGARASEVLGITRDRVFPEEGQVVIDRQLCDGGQLIPARFGPTKGRKPRTVDVGAAVMAAIVEHLSEFYVDNEHGLLLVDEDGWPMGYHRLNYYHREAWESAGIKTLDHFHDLRHLSASVAYDAGASLVEIQGRLGHGQVTTTMKYVHGLRKKAEASANALDAAIRLV